MPRPTVTQKQITVSEVRAFDTLLETKKTLVWENKTELKKKWIQFNLLFTFVFVFLYIRCFILYYILCYILGAFSCIIFLLSSLFWLFACTKWGCRQSCVCVCVSWSGLFTRDQGPAWQNSLRHHCSVKVLGESRPADARWAQLQDQNTHINARRTTITSAHTHQHTQNHNHLSTHTITPVSAVQPLGYKDKQS